MDPIKITLSVDMIEELFDTSPRTKEYECCTTLILELQQATEIILIKHLLEGRETSIPKCFDHALDDLVFIEQDWRLLS
jgi:hypothetical protein